MLPGVGPVAFCRASISARALSSCSLSPLVCLVVPELWVAPSLPFVGPGVCSWDPSARLTKAGLPQLLPTTGRLGSGTPTTAPEFVPSLLGEVRSSVRNRVVLESPRCRGGPSRNERRCWQNAHIEASRCSA